MKQKRFLALKRAEFFTQTDLLANCGGLLGLFLGISMLSLFEIVYYLTLRLVCNLSRKRRVQVAENSNIFIVEKFEEK